MILHIMMQYERKIKSPKNFPTIFFPVQFHSLKRSLTFEWAFKSPSCVDVVVAGWQIKFSSFRLESSSSLLYGCGFTYFRLAFAHKSPYGTRMINELCSIRCEFKFMITSPARTETNIARRRLLAYLAQPAYDHKDD